MEITQLLDIAEGEGRHFDFFYHYDSAAPPVINGTMNILVPKDGPYWVSFTNLTVTIANGNTPDAHSGFLMVTGMTSNQGGICNPGYPKLTKVLFPLTNPTSGSPVCKTYNKLLLQSSDSITLSYGDNNMVMVPTTRIVATMHISSSSHIIRSSLLQ